MICGKMTPRQRQIASQRCKIDANKYSALLKWLQQNHASYKDIEIEEDSSVVQPVNLGGLETTLDNDDDSSDPKVEELVSDNHFTFAPRDDVHQHTGTCATENEFVSSILDNNEPTLLFRGGDFIPARQEKIEDIFPVQFPFGLGALKMNKKRPTEIAKEHVLQHYSQLSLPQLQQSDFLLITCAMLQ